jgi:primosomal protein N' (replication factor Y)
MTPARARVLAAAGDGAVRGKGELAREAGVSAGVVDGLIDEGALQTVALLPGPSPGGPTRTMSGPTCRTGRARPRAS